METVLIILVAIILVEVSYLVYKTTNHKLSNRRRTVFVDTSALMDGRIVTAAQAGFIPDSLVIPRSVVAELQLLADQADGEKRTRARRGLDAIHELQEVDGLGVKIMNDGPVGAGGVDERLVELASKHGGMLCTIDFNLNKVATVRQVPVLNINELAGSLRMAFLPGETMSLALSQKGQGKGQAVGYLADGTMVVVDDAQKDVGTTIQVEFIRSLQTAAGRMMFAKPLKKRDTPKVSNSRADAPSPDKKVAAAKPKPTGRRTKPSKRTNEDSLIELVNNQ